jgi:hypothetical protein
MGRPGNEPEPVWVRQPVNFTGLTDTTVALKSTNAFTWTGSALRLEGMDATDAYQPGFPALLADPEAITEFSRQNLGDSVDTGAFAGTIHLFMRQAGEGWHGHLASVFTGSGLASDNLPPPATRGGLQQSERFRWQTRDNVQIAGPLSSRADIFLSASGQWDSRTIPVAAGQTQNSRLLFGNAGGRFQLTSRDQLNARYSGSRIDNSNWTQPAGLEALIGWRMMPTLDLPRYGINGLAETDHLDSLQAGWTHEFTGQSQTSILEVRYQFLPAHLNTFPDALFAGQQSKLELTTGAVTGSPPLSNMAVRTRQQIASRFRNGLVNFLSMSHDFSFGATYDPSASRNRFSAPLALNLITADAGSAEAVELNTPLDSRQQIRNSEVYASDRIHITSFLTATTGILANFSRGSLPAQSSPAGDYAAARAFPAKNDVIVWNSASPQVGLALQIPHVNRLIVRANFDRRYAPLAGQYLDFANPNSLSGLVYQWNDMNADGVFQPLERGLLLRRFGGEYSSISPSLRRPYANEFTVSAEAALPLSTAARIQFYRRDEKNRIAVLNVGVPPSDYLPIVIDDPGPDFIPNTFDDQVLTVWNQNPQTLGHDQYLLTNPEDLRMMYKGFTAGLWTEHRHIAASASFTAEKSYGPTNPGDGALENDSGVVGALYQDPNTLINSANRDFFDRAYVGKLQTITHLPRRLARFEITNTVNYMDGLVFARQLLVSGLNQGPVLVATTVRGSPEGGNRAEYFLNWNLQLSRNFPFAWGKMTTTLDLMNVMNSQNRIQESDVSGPDFNARLPVAIEPARFVRLGLSLYF